MQQDSEKPRKAFPWGTPVSIFAHLVIAAVFLLNIPAKQSTPEQEQAVNVELVPPAEEKKPEEKKPEEAKKEEKKPEEKPPEEKPLVKLPEMPKAETKPEEPPPLPPEPPKEEAKEEPKPGPPKPQPRPVIPVMKRVYEFGPEDSGPEQSDKGNAAATEVKPSETEPSTPPQAKPDHVSPLEKPASAAPVAKGIDLPKVQTADTHSEKDAPTALGPDDAKVSLETEKALEVATPEKTDPSTPAKPNATPIEEDKLNRPKKLFSQKSNSGARGTTAMGNLSQETRVGQLCQSEMVAQLQQSTPSYSPLLAPTYLGTGSTVLSVDRGAFLNPDGWYDVSFRCEVNRAATKVISFDLNVGNRVPRSEWKSRNFPDY